MWSNFLTSNAVDFFATPMPIGDPFTLNEVVKEGTVRIVNPFFTETDVFGNGHRVASSLAVAAVCDIGADKTHGAGGVDYRSMWRVISQDVALRDPAPGTYVFMGTLLGRRRLGHEIYFHADFGGVVTADNLPPHVEVPKKSSDPA